MKSWKTLLVAAAATIGSSSQAADYRVEWTGGIEKMTAILSVDLTAPRPVGFRFWTSGPGTWLTAATLTSDNGLGTVNTVTNLNELNDGEIFTFGIVGADAPFLGRALTSAEISQLNFHWHFVGNVTFGIIHTSGDFVDMPPSGLTGPLLMTYFGPNGVSDIAAWMYSVNNAQRTYSAGYNMTVVALEGAHHRPLMSYDDMGKERATWVTGDFANSSRRRDVNVASGEVGTSWKAGANGVFGVAAGYGSQREDLALDGRNDVDGKYMFAEYDHRLASGWIVSVLGMVGSWDAEILRGYLNAGVPDHSYGETGVATRTARLRFDAPTLATVGGFGLSPFVSYSVTQTEVDAYTETGGAFPASYDAQKHQSEEGRLGLVGTRDLTASTRLRLSFEAIHRFDGQGPSLTGQDITGGVAFELDGSDPSPDCVRYGLDIDHKLTPTTMLSVSAFGSSTGEVPDVSGAISLRHAF
jgi:hypothetical protein